jgi:hypothetical protein
LVLLQIFTLKLISQSFIGSQNVVGPSFCLYNRIFSIKKGEIPEFSSSSCPEHMGEAVDHSIHANGRWNTPMWRDNHAQVPIPTQHLPPCTQSLVPCLYVGIV